MLPRLKPLVLNAFLCVLSTVVAYVLGEIFVRIWFPQPMLPRYVTDTPYGIRKNMANLNIWHTSPDYHVNVRTNSRGIRSDQGVPYEKPPGVFRIVGLGDSFTLGYEVEVEDTYLHQLEKKLHARGAAQVEVVNLAVSGFGTAEELITLREEGFKYAPDLVILGYFVNDIENNITSNLFALRRDTVRRAALTYLPAVEIRQVLYAIPGYRALADHSQLLNIFRNRISYIVQKGLFQRNRERATAASDSSVSAYEATLTARLLDEVYTECETRGIPLLILNIPNTTFATGQMLSNIPIDRMHHKDQVIYVDAQDILRPYVGRREIQWERWHNHWRPWVHHRVAEVLADTVMVHAGLPLLKACAP